MSNKKNMISLRVVTTLKQKQMDTTTVEKFELKAGIYSCGDLEYFDPEDYYIHPDDDEIRDRWNDEWCGYGRYLEAGTYNRGLEKVLSEEEEEKYNAEYRQGYDAAFFIGYQDGYSYAERVVNLTGTISSGYSQGYNFGYTDGYNWGEESRREEDNEANVEYDEEYFRQLFISSLDKILNAEDSGSILPAA